TAFPRRRASRRARGRRGGGPLSVADALRALADKAPDATLGATATFGRIASPRYWRAVHRWQRFVEESERWSPERLDAYQLERLRTLLAHSAEHVPYYRALFAEHGFEPGDLASLDDVRAL